MYSYHKDQELPAMAFNWRDGSNNTLPLSSGWVGTIKITLASNKFVILSTITTGLTYADVAPNVLWSPSIGDWAPLAAAANGTKYTAWLYVRRNSDSKDDVWKPGIGEQFTLFPAPA